VTSINDAAAKPIQVVAPINTKDTEYVQRRSPTQTFGQGSAKALITPAVSLTNGGTKITIEVSNFTSPPTTVKIGGATAKIIATTTSQVVIQTPPSRAGTFDVNLSNTKQSLNIPKAFTYRVK
jgi:hypothetical protein